MKRRSKKHEIEFDINTLMERLEELAVGTQSIKEQVKSLDISKRSLKMIDESFHRGFIFGVISLDF